MALSISLLLVISVILIFNTILFKRLLRRSCRHCGLCGWSWCRCSGAAPTSSFSIRPLSAFWAFNSPSIIFGRPPSGCRNFELFDRSRPLSAGSRSVPAASAELFQWLVGAWCLPVSILAVSFGTFHWSDVFLFSK